MEKRSPSKSQMIMDLLLPLAILLSLSFNKQLKLSFSLTNFDFSVFKSNNLSCLLFAINICVLFIFSKHFRCGILYLECLLDIFSL